MKIPDTPFHLENCSTETCNCEKIREIREKKRDKKTKKILDKVR